MSLRRASGRHAMLSVAVAMSVLATMMVATAPRAFADNTVTSFSFVSAPGDFIGAGQTRTFTDADAQFGAGGTAGRVIFSVWSGSVSWVVNLAAPRGSQLLPGSYDNAVRVVSATGTQSGIDVSGEGRGCNNDFGSFDIRAISVDSHGVVNLLDATFTEHCETADAPPLTGVVKYRAPVSAPIVLTSSNPSVLLDQPTTLTADVSSATAGTVEFFDGSTSIGTAPIRPTGLAELATSSLALGNHSLTASYNDSLSAPILQAIRDNTRSFWFSSGWSLNTVGQGATESFSSPDDAVDVHGGLSYLQVNAISGVERWHVFINAPVGETLRVGSYPTVSTDTTSGPGLSVAGNGSSCGASSGSLDISTIQLDASGDIAAFDASFVMYCTGAPTIPFNGTIKYFVASDPTAPRFPLAFARDGEAIVHWSPPAFAGSPPLTQYVITAYIGVVPVKVQTFASPATSQVMTGLVNGRTYRFKIAAKNAVTGPPSAATNAVTIGAPAAPTSVHATAGAGKATVRWAAPANNGAPITGYTIWPYINGVVKPSRTFASSATTEVFTGLPPGLTYTFKVAARNARGTGSQSAASNAITPT